jgi:hypothetical protein
METLIKLLKNETGSVRSVFLHVVFVTTKSDLIFDNGYITTI